jgi:hypothetical protein
MQYLISLNVWSRVKALSDRSQTRTAAIAYVTTDAMIRLGAGDLLVTDASDNAVACGETSAPVLRDAIERGAEIYSCKGLHAKVIVFDGITVIGSANLSERSERDLVEAVWVTDDPTVVAEARSFVQRLAAQSERIDKPHLARILSIKIARRLPTLSKRDQNLSLDGQGSDADPDIVRVLSDSRLKSGATWSVDPRLVLMDPDAVRKLSRFRRLRLIGTKAYQVKQVRAVIVKYRLAGGANAQ